MGEGNSCNDCGGPDGPESLPVLTLGPITGTDALTIAELTCDYDPRRLARQTASENGAGRLSLHAVWGSCLAAAAVERLGGRSRVTDVKLFHHSQASVGDTLRVTGAVENERVRSGKMVVRFAVRNQRGTRITSGKAEIHREYL